MFSEIRIGRQIWNNSKVSSNKIRICFLSAFRYGKMANVICYDRSFKCVTVYLYKSLLNVLPLDNSQLIGLETCHRFLLWFREGSSVFSKPCI